MMSRAAEPLKPILIAHLFPKLDRLLIELLRSLSAEEWEKQTVSPKWKVRDVAAHLLDTALRGLSVGRDKFVAETPVIRSAPDLAAFINRLNAEGVNMYGRLSPRVLISLLDVTAEELAEFHALRDPYGVAPFGVSWAGEEKSANWFDTARELTERWHHQQQIRLAVGKPGILTPELYHPVLDCFLRALPFHFRGISAKPDSYVHILIAGECGGSWYLHRTEDKWELQSEPSGRNLSEVLIPQEIAWRIFTKGIARESALKQTKISGDPELGLLVLGMVSIVA